MADGTWSVAEAKARLSEVIERARTQGPQHVTRNGKDAVVVVSAETWAMTSEPRGQNFLEALLDPTARVLTAEEAESLFARDKDAARPLDL